jgi:hypothetical protein
MGSPSRAYIGQSSPEKLFTETLTDGRSGALSVRDRAMPRCIFRSPVKKTSPKSELTGIERLAVEPPILAREERIAKEGVTSPSRSKTDEYNEMTMEQLRAAYRDLTARYRSGLDDFKKLEKKRKIMMLNLGRLKARVAELNAEQKKVDEEYERLGLSSSRTSFIS